MGKIMHGGINYSGSGGSGSSVISLTQAQYDELTPEEKMDPDKVYYISDGVSPGSINYLGVFIDEDNVIQPGTSISGVTTYTATEDCAIVVLYSATTSAQSSVDINNVTVLSFGGANVSLRNVLLVKKGDVVKFTPAGTYNTYYVYGLKHGSSTGTGGSVVEPNPEDPATEELTKIGIEGTVYSVRGASAVSELTDVELTDLADGEILKYDAIEEKWVNAEDGGSTGGSVVALPTLYSTKEKMVGLWTDNKPLYQKTFATSVALASGVWATTGDSIPNGIGVNAFAVARGASSDTVPVWCEIGSDGHIELLNIRNSGTVTITHYTIQYTKTTDTPVEDLNLQDFGIFTPVIYSLDEREIGVWTDGKPLYQKTIYYPNIAKKSWGGLSFGVENANVVDLQGYILTNNGIKWAINYYQGGSYFSVYWTDSAMVLYWDYGSATSALAYITIQYTKTTDVAGSGSYAELGAPAVHYDDTERIIGTFFGETLYRKTVKIASLPSSATGSTYPHGISDIKDIWAVYAFAKWQNGTITPMNMTQIVGGNFIVNASIYYSVDKTNITINPGTDRSALSGVVTIEYTKTTS